MGKIPGQKAEQCKDENYHDGHHQFFHISFFVHLIIGDVPRLQKTQTILINNFLVSETIDLWFILSKNIGIITKTENYKKQYD